MDSPSFEEEFNALLLASDQSDSEGDIEEFLVSEREFLQLRESDQDEDLEENIPEVDSSNVGSQITREGDSTDSSDDALPLSELRKSNFYYGKDRYKWSKTPPNARVRTLQHNIITHACGSKLTGEDAKDPLSIWHKLFDEEMLQHVLTWTNKKIASYRMKFARQNKPELKDIDMTELKAFVGQICVVCRQLLRELRLVIKRVLADDMVEEDVQSPETSQGKRRACSICPPKLHRMTVYTCVGCCNPVCLQCSRPLCKNCQ